VLQSETWSLSGGVHHWFNRKSIRKNLWKKREEIITIIITTIINASALWCDCWWFYNVAFLHDLTSRPGFSAECIIGMKWQETGKICMAGIFVICTVHQMLLG
jgi:hypothetical protein